MTLIPSDQPQQARDGIDNDHLNGSSNDQGSTPERDIQRSTLESGTSSRSEEIELTPDVIDTYNKSKTIRTYRQGLSVPKELRQVLMNHLESYTRGVRSAQGALLKLFGGLDSSLVKKSFPSVHKGKLVADLPSDQEQIARQIVLTRLWLFPVSVEGAPEEYICGAATDKNKTIPKEEAEKRRAILREILTEQGLDSDEIEQWLDNCRYELEAPVTEGRCLVNTRQMYLDNRDVYGAEFRADTSFELLNYIFGDPEALLSLDVSDPEGAEGGTAKGSTTKSLDLPQGMGSWLGRVRPSEKYNSSSIDYGRFRELFEGVVEVISRSPQDSTLPEVLGEIIDSMEPLRRTEENAAPLPHDISSLTRLFEEGTNAKELTNIRRSRLLRHIKETGSLQSDLNTTDTAEILNHIKECCEVDAHEYSKQISRGRRAYADTMIQGIEEAFGYKLGGDGPDNEGNQLKVLKAILGEAAQDISKTVTNVKKKMQLRFEKQREVAKLRATIPDEKRELLETFCTRCNQADGKRYFLRESARFLPAIVDVYRANATKSVEARVEAARKVVHEDRDESKRRGGWLTIFEHLATPEGLTVLQDEEDNFTDSYVSAFFQARDLEQKIQSRTDVDSMRMADPDFSLRSAPLSEDKGTKIAHGALELARKIRAKEQAPLPVAQWFDNFRAQWLEDHPGKELTLQSDDIRELEKVAKAIFKKWTKASEESRDYRRWSSEREGDIVSLAAYRRHLVEQDTDEGAVGREFLSALASDEAWDAWHHPTKNDKPGSFTFNHLRKVLEAYSAQCELNVMRDALRADIAAGKRRPQRSSADSSNQLDSVDMSLFDGTDFVQRAFHFGSDRVLQELLFDMYPQDIVTSREGGPSRNVVTLPRDTTFARAAFGVGTDDTVRVGGLTEKKGWYTLFKLSKATKEKFREIAQSDLTLHEKAEQREEVVSQARMEILTAFDLQRLPGVVGRYLHKNGIDLFPASNIYSYLKKRNVAEKRDSTIAKLNLSRMPAGIRTASVRILSDAMAARVAIVETLSREGLRHLCDDAGVEYPDQETLFLEISDPETGKKTRYVRNAPDTYQDDNGEVVPHPSPWSRIERVETVRMPGDRRNGDKIRSTYRAERSMLRGFAESFDTDALTDDVLYRLDRSRDAVNSVLDTALQDQETLALVALSFNPERALFYDKDKGEPVTIVDTIDTVRTLLEIGKRDPFKRPEHEQLYRKFIEPRLSPREREQISDNATRSRAFTKLKKQLTKNVSYGLKEWYKLAYRQERPDLEMKALFELHVLPLMEEKEQSEFKEAKKRPGIFHNVAQRILTDEQKIRGLWQVSEELWTKRDSNVSEWVPKIRDWYSGSTKLTPRKVTRNGKRELVYPSEGGLALERLVQVQAFRGIDSSFVSRATPHGRDQNRRATYADAKYVKDDLNRRDAARDELTAEILRSVLGIVDVQKSDDAGQHAKYEQRYDPCHICIYEDEISDAPRTQRAGDNATRAIMAKKTIKENISSALELLDVGLMYAAPERIQRHYATGDAMLKVREVSLSEFIRQDTPLWKRISDAKRRIEAERIATEKGKTVAKTMKPTAVDYYLRDLDARYDRTSKVWTDGSDQRWQLTNDGTWESLDSADITVALQPVVIPDKNGNLLLSAASGQKLTRSHNRDTNAVLRNALKKLQDPDWSRHIERLELDAKTLKPVAKEVKGSRVVSKQDVLTVSSADGNGQSASVTNGKPKRKNSKAESYPVFRDPSGQNVVDDRWLRAYDYEESTEDRAVAKLREYLGIEHMQ